MTDRPLSRNDPSDIVHIAARRRGTHAAIIAVWSGREAYVGEVIALRARLVQRLDDLQRQLATYHTFDDPGAGDAADRLVAVALAIEELDTLTRDETEAASG